eukprot:s3753_g1.t1
MLFLVNMRVSLSKVLGTSHGSFKDFPTLYPTLAPPPELAALALELGTALGAAVAEGAEAGAAGTDCLQGATGRALGSAGLSILLAALMTGLAPAACATEPPWQQLP